MGRLIVVEGLDGAGKRTLSDALCTALAAKGARVARFAFPRYDADVHAELAREALYGRHGDLAASVHGMALLFALDRRAAAPELQSARAAHDVVLIDRYIASNAAYNAARRTGIRLAFRPPHLRAAAGAAAALRAAAVHAGAQRALLGSAREARRRGAALHPRHHRRQQCAAHR